MRSTRLFGSAAEGLDQMRNAAVLDITCDSDGTVDHYVMVTVARQCLYRSTIRITPMLSFFMVGACQESSAAQPVEAVDVFHLP